MVTDSSAERQAETRDSGTCYNAGAMDNKLERNVSRSDNRRDSSPASIPNVPEIFH